MAEPVMMRCAGCGAVNRVPEEKLEQGLTPVCGRCGTKLSASGRPITVTDENFTAEVERSALPVLLDIWAPWCGPCRMVEPAVEQLAQEMAGTIRVGKLNVDENPMTAQRFQIQNIPAMLILRGGREIGRIVGAQGESQIRQQVERALGIGPA